MLHILSFKNSLQIYIHIYDSHFEFKAAQNEAHNEVSLPHRMSVITDQGVPAGVMDHPSFFHHRAALPFCVLNGLYNPHKRNIIAC